MDLSKKYEYFDLGKQLVQKYPHLQFDDHCYWRIALDNTLNNKWKNVIPPPAYRNLSEEQLDYTLHLLRSYLKDEQLLLEHNKNSLAYRVKE